MMKLLPLLIILSSCANFPAQPVKVINFPEQNKSQGSRYLSCIKDLNSNGLRQSLIKELCDSAVGSME